MGIRLQNKLIEVYGVLKKDALVADLYSQDMEIWQIQERTGFSKYMIQTRCQRMRKLLECESIEDMRRKLLLLDNGASFDPLIVGLG